MLRFTAITENAGKVHATATLSLDQRVRSRQKIALDNGETAALFLPRGSTLQDGSLIRADSGEIVRIRAADETVSTARVADPVALARACYHLGNRHVALQIGADFVRYQHDHVLDDMLRGMGLDVVCEQAPFEPEPGAYGGHGHHHHEH